MSALPVGGRHAVRTELRPDALVPVGERERTPARTIESIPERPDAFLAYLNEHAYPEGRRFLDARNRRGLASLSRPGGARRLTLTLFSGPSGADCTVILPDARQTVKMTPGQTSVVSFDRAAGPRRRAADRRRVRIFPSVRSRSGVNRQPWARLPGSGRTRVSPGRCRYGQRSRFAGYAIVAVVVCLGCSSAPSGPPPALACPSADPGRVARTTTLCRSRSRRRSPQARSPFRRRVRRRAGRSSPSARRPSAVPRPRRRASLSCTLQRDRFASTSPREDEDARVRRQHHLRLRAALSAGAVAASDGRRRAAELRGRTRCRPEPVSRRAADMLRDRYTAQQPIVVNAGLPGEFVNDSETRRRFTRTLNENAPEVLLLQEGINDLHASASTAFQRTQGIARLVDALRGMASTRAAGGCRSFSATLLPQRPNGCRAYAIPPRGDEDLITPTNDQIRAMAAAEHLDLIDLDALFAGQLDTLLAQDGLHPSDAGYSAIAKAFFDAIRQKFGSRCRGGRHQPEPHWSEPAIGRHHARPHARHATSTASKQRGQRRADATPTELPPIGPIDRFARRQDARGSVTPRRRTASGGR